ncbi:MAG: hypothetical protein IKZ43_08380 [Acidaminococcaceae bacterium]|nr:hypothetical protein [Acidaminococcaceae bacterium]
MEIVYSNNKVYSQCTSFKAAKKLFGGQESLAISLLARINAIENALNIKDIIVQKPFRFHQLNYFKGSSETYFAIDVKTIREPWRLILRPLDNDKQPFIPCHIDEVAEIVEIVEIREVSNHYE